MATFGDQTILVVERFEREWMDEDAWIARLPQEDFCQALGFSPKQKYEHDGGPGMLTSLQLLTGSADPQQDTLVFQLTQLAFWLMAATDGHAKNYSIFLQPGDTDVMTPLYDILSMRPHFGKGPNQFNRRLAWLAMAMQSRNVDYRFDTIHAGHWHQLAIENGGPVVWDAMVGLVEQVGSALAAVEARLPKDFHGRPWGAISKGMMAEVERFLSGVDGL